MLNAKNSYSPPDRYGFSTFARWIEGWINAGFNSQVTSLRTRRVNRDGKDEVQIEVKITEHRQHGKSERCFEMHGSLCLNSEEASRLILALGGVLP